MFETLGINFLVMVTIWFTIMTCIILPLIVFEFIYTKKKTGRLSLPFEEMLKYNVLSKIVHFVKWWSISGFVVGCTKIIASLFYLVKYGWNIDIIKYDTIFHIQYTLHINVFIFILDFICLIMCFLIMGATSLCIYEHNNELNKQEKEEE